MKAAAQMAQANASKEELAAELEKVSEEIKAGEKRKDWLKAKLMPLMAVGERIGMVEKLSVSNLVVDDELLAALEKELGPSVVRREANIKVLREMMIENKALEARIPKGPAKTQLRVGESFNR
jgi:acetate kinase